jgi:tetratricopeptide (TPR) repeat protein
MRGNIPALGVVLALAFAGPHVRAEQRPMIDAREGSVGIGGNVTYSTITIGVPAEKIEELIRSRTKDLGDLAESQQETIAQLKQTLSLTQGQVSHALKILGEANIPPEQLAAKLEEIAEKFKDLQQAAAAQPGDDAKITALKAGAQKAIQDGQLGKADEVLADIEKAQTEALDRLALNAAQTAAQRGDVALGRLRYVDAAQHFAEAAAKVPPGNKDERVKYLNAEASALLERGFEFGDDTAALSAIARYRALVELLPRNASPRDWASAQNNLGFALFRLGARESGTARLEEAVVAYHEALQELTRERVPLRWATTQKNLGLALIKLGERETGTALLEEAVAVLQEALQEGTRARAPLLWAFIQNNLGGALVRLGERESGTARLEEAVVVLQEALQEATRARVPLLWASTQVGLGQALQAIGERESGTARLEQAVATYQEALQEATRARVPLLWANTQVDLGQALQAIGERESGTARLEQAVAAYHEALQEFTRARAPLLWAKRTGSQGVALMLLAGRTGDAEMAKLAVEQMETAITTLRHDGGARSAEFFETRLLLARALVDQLTKR